MMDETLLAALALTTAAVVLATAVTTLFFTVRARQQVQEVHVLVNKHNDKLNKRIDQLTAALVKGGVATPPREDLNNWKVEE
jgi:predicted PurR-regulated permease PerM